MDTWTAHTRDRLLSALHQLETAAAAANETETHYLYARARLADAEDQVLLAEPPDGKNAETMGAQLHSRTLVQRNELLDAEQAFHGARRHYETARDAVKVACALAALAEHGG